MGNELKAFREMNGYKIQNVSEYLGVPYHSYCNWEYGHRTPSIDILIKLSKLYNCSVDDLLGIKKDPPETDEPISGEVIYQFLIDNGYVKDGEDLSESDLKFLSSIMDIVAEWFEAKASNAKR